MNLTTIKTTLIGNKWLVVGVGVLFLAASVWFVTNRLASYERTLVIAELKEKAVNEKEEILKKSQEDFLRGVRNTQKDIINLSFKQANIEKEKKDNKEKIDKVVEEVLIPNKNLENVIKDVKQFLEMTGQITGDGRISFDKQDTQHIVALKLDYERLDNELKATQNQLVLEQEKTAKLTVELANAIKTIEGSNELLKEYKLVLEEYKRAAKKSRWMVAKDYIKQGVTIGITALIVSQAAK